MGGGYLLGPVTQDSGPQPLAPGTDFTEDNFSRTWVGFGMIPALYIFCVLSFSSNASADLEGGIAPWPGSWGPLT